MVYVEVIKSCDVGSECPRARLNIFFVIFLTACAVDCLMFARFVEIGPWKYSKRGFLRTATIITVLGRLYAWSNRRSWGEHVLRRASGAHHVQRRRHLEDLSNPFFFLAWHKKPAPRSLPLVVRDWDGDACAWGVCVGSSFYRILVSLIHAYFRTKRRYSEFHFCKNRRFVNIDNSIRFYIYTISYDINST